MTRALWRRTVAPAVVPAWALVLTAILLWPLRRGGHLLGHDLVFTPRQPLTAAAVGVSSSSPRAVPLDALVALAERVVDGAVVGRFAVALPLVAAGIGTAVLLGRAGVVARLAACSFAVWNPYVVERTALGQWALLWAYAALPFVVLAVSRCRGRPAVGVLAIALAAAAITPTGALVAGVTAVVVAVVTGRRGRDLAVPVVLAAVVQLPWLLPALTSSASATSDPRAVGLFASRDEFGGPLITLLTGGGVWNGDVVPPSRSGVLGLVALVVVIAAGVVGARRLVTLIGRRTVTALGGLAAAGFVLAALASLPGGDALVRTLVEHVPGAGLLRDAHKWVMPLVLLEALLVGAAADRLVRSLRPTRYWLVTAGVAAAVLPVLLLPDATTPVHRTMQPVHYPHDWAVVARRLDGSPDAALVLPFASYRTFPWAPGRASVLDPAPRLLPVETVVSDRLAVGGTLLRGEDPRARSAERALSGDAGTLARRLAALGIGWVVVEHRTPGAVTELGALRESYRGRDVSVYRVPGAVRDDDPAAWRWWVVLGGDAVAALAVLVCAGAGLVAWRGRSSRWSRSAV